MSILSVKRCALTAKVSYSFLPYLIGSSEQLLMPPSKLISKGINADILYLFARKRLKCYSL
jgi:hypothetical protein